MYICAYKINRVGYLNKVTCKARTADIVQWEQIKDYYNSNAVHSRRYPNRK